MIFGLLKESSINSFLRYKRLYIVKFKYESLKGF